MMIELWNTKCKNLRKSKKRQQKCCWILLSVWFYSLCVFGVILLKTKAVEVKEKINTFKSGFHSINTKKQHQIHEWKLLSHIFRLYSSLFHINLYSQQLGKNQVWKLFLEQNFWNSGGHIYQNSQPLSPHLWSYLHWCWNAIYSIQQWISRVIWKN